MAAEKTQHDFGSAGNDAMYLQESLERKMKDYYRRLNKADLKEVARRLTEWVEAQEVPERYEN